jgi:MbtH protein
MAKISEPRLNDKSVDGDVFRALTNEEGQHSVWPAGLEIPENWAQIGPKAECVAFIDSNWTDMRPKSLRMVMTRRVESGN